ncbi:MAG: phosphoglycerate kinase [Saprospiraceae bacterium]
MNLDVNGKKVLVRVDFNVPLNGDFEVTDDTRIRGALPTIKKLLENGAAVILMSHLGRPQKKLKDDGSIDVEKFTLKHIIPTLSNLLGQDVKFANDCVGGAAMHAASSLKPGEVLLLENTRFHKGEEKGEENLAKQMSELGDIYINDAFGTAHRAHASTAVIAKFFESGKKGFGLLMDAEIKNANKVLKTPERPLTAIIGGAKVSDKILLLDRLIDFVDNLLIGGGMAYTFFKAKGGNVGNSLVEEDRLETALDLMKKAEEKGVKLILPQDSVIADKFDNDAAILTMESDNQPNNWMGLDIGPKAQADFIETIENSKTILWNGPMGVFEMSNFANGTKVIAQAVAKATSNGAYSLIGGGDSVAAINQMHLANEVSYVSTGGGAMLEFLEGKKLPGIEAIEG